MHHSLQDDGACARVPSTLGSCLARLLAPGRRPDAPIAGPSRTLVPWPDRVRLVGGRDGAHRQGDGADLRRALFSDNHGRTGAPADPYAFDLEPMGRAAIPADRAAWLWRSRRPASRAGFFPALSA